MSTRQLAIETERLQHYAEAAGHYEQASLELADAKEVFRVAERNLHRAAMAVASQAYAAEQAAKKGGQP